MYTDNTCGTHTISQLLLLQTMLHDVLYNIMKNIILLLLLPPPTANYYLLLHLIIV